MRENDPHEKMEKALMRLMPVALSDSTQAAIEERIDEMAGCGVVRYDFPHLIKWLGGIAAAVAIGVFAFPYGIREAAPRAETVPEPEEGMVVLAEMDRVENVRDEGLFVDAGGSAVRKMRVRVVGESRMLDEETGIEVTLTSPREEMYLLPVSTF